jgi:uncharacterized protein (TIGR02646 family)
MQGQQINSDDADDKAKFILGLRCAYCEGIIFYGGHIEHFRRKNPAHFPQLTFAWSNLFLACGSNDHCGHYKDKKGRSYDPNDLIKPDDHDPNDYLYFHSSGEVRVRNREGIADVDQRRAQETIRVFNLNEPGLKGARARALEAYKKRSPSIIDDLMEFEPDEREVFIQQEIEATRWDPFSTTIHNFFESAL